MTTIYGDVHIHIHPAACSELNATLATIIRSQTAIMKNQAELVEDLKLVQANQLKVADEIRAQSQRITDLQDIITNTPAVSPELAAAVEAVAAGQKNLDDLNPDAQAVS